MELNLKLSKTRKQKFCHLLKKKQLVEIVIINSLPL